MSFLAHHALQTVQVDNSGSHTECALKSGTEALTEHLIEQVKLVGADEEIKKSTEEVEPVIVPQLLNDAQVVHDLLDSHLVESSDLQVTLIRIRLPNDLAADDQEQAKSSHPAHFSDLAEACQREPLRFV